MKRALAKFSMAGLMLAISIGSVSAAPDWNRVPSRDIQVFHPGVASYEWMMNKSLHSGSTGLSKGESCKGCHENRSRIDIDMARLASKELEPVGAPKTMSFPVSVQAVYDAENLYIRLTFKAPADAAAEAPREDKSPLHGVKAAVMFASPKVENAALHGCWLSCHADVRSMPNADPKKKKHFDRGDLASGVFYDYIQWKSGEAGKGVTQADGHVTNERINKGGKSLTTAEGELKGDVYTVTFVRKLAGDSADGDLMLAAGQTIPFGVAIHADKTVWRFHHVSLGYTLGLGAPGTIQAVKQ